MGELGPRGGAGANESKSWTNWNRIETELEELLDENSIEVGGRGVVFKFSWNVSAAQ